MLTIPVRPPESRLFVDEQVTAVVIFSFKRVFKYEI